LRRTRGRAVFSRCQKKSTRTRERKNAAAPRLREEEETKDENRRRNEGNQPGGETRSRKGRHQRKGKRNVKTKKGEQQERGVVANEPALNINRDGEKVVRKEENRDAVTQGCKKERSSRENSTHEMAGVSGKPVGTRTTREKRYRISPAKRDPIEGNTGRIEKKEKRDERTKKQVGARGA